MPIPLGSAPIDGLEFARKLSPNWLTPRWLVAGTESPVIVLLPEVIVVPFKKTEYPPGSFVDPASSEATCLVVFDFNSPKSNRFPVDVVQSGATVTPTQNVR